MNKADPYLHIFSQTMPHDEAFIVGTPEALAALRDAIDRAIKDGGSVTKNMFAGDGEGFDIYVGTVEVEKIRTMMLPYIDPFLDYGNAFAEHPWSILQATWEKLRDR